MVVVGGFVIAVLHHSRTENAENGGDVPNGAGSSRAGGSVLYLPLRILLRGGPLALLLLLLARLLLGAMAAIGAAGDGAEHAVMAGIVTGDAADRGALQAALGVGGIRGQGQRCDGKQGGDR